MKKKLKNHIFKDEKIIGHVFLGVGLLLFVLNISAFLNIIPNFIPNSTAIIFDVSIFSSIIIVVSAIFLIHK